MKKTTLFLAAIAFSLAAFAQTTVTSVSTADIITVKNSSGISEKKMTRENFDDVVGNRTPSTTGTETKTVSGAFSLTAAGTTISAASGYNVTFGKQSIQLRTATTYTATGSITVTAAELAGGLLVAATSTATTTFTLPTAAQIVTQMGAAAGSTFEFVVVNNGASNGTVTVAVGSGITASDFPGTNTLTRTGSATVGAAVFRLTFLTTSAAILTRVS